MSSYGSFNGITCKVCRLNELQLEAKGIAMNVPLETCNICLQKDKKVIRDPVGPSNRQKRAEDFVKGVSIQYDVILEAIRQGGDPRDAGLSTEEMAEEFLVLIQRVERINKL